MAKEYIEREEAIQYFKERSKDFIGHEPIPPALVIMGCANEVDAIPAADVAPVVRGRWVRDEYGVIHCSVCNAYLKDEEYENHTFKKCYYCGADMRTSEELESPTYIPPEERSVVDDG